MSDYIDRAAAIDAICEHGTDLERNGITVLAVANHKQVTVDLLEQLPSANVEPVRHGRVEWRKEKTVWQTGYYCSECQAFFGKDYDMVKYFNYCPNCGAFMENGEEA